MSTRRETKAEARDRQAREDWETREERRQRALEAQLEINRERNARMRRWEVYERQNPGADIDKWIRMDKLDQQQRLPVKQEKETPKQREDRENMERFRQQLTEREKKERERREFSELNERIQTGFYDEEPVLDTLIRQQEEQRRRRSSGNCEPVLLTEVSRPPRLGPVTHSDDDEEYDTPGPITPVVSIHTASKPPPGLPSAFLQNAQPQSPAASDEEANCPSTGPGGSQGETSSPPHSQHDEAAERRAVDDQSALWRDWDPVGRYSSTRPRDADMLANDVMRAQASAFIRAQNEIFMLMSQLESYDYMGVKPPFLILRYEGRGVDSHVYIRPVRESIQWIPILAAQLVRGECQVPELRLPQFYVRFRVLQSQPESDHNRLHLVVRRGRDSIGSPLRLLRDDEFEARTEFLRALKRPGPIGSRVRGNEVSIDVLSTASVFLVPRLHRHTGEATVTFMSIETIYTPPPLSVLAPEASSSSSTNKPSKIKLDRRSNDGSASI